MRVLLSISSVLILSACATMHPGYEGKVVSGDPNLVVSAERNGDYSDETNQFYTVTIENKGSHWLRFDEVDIDFTNDDHAEHRLVVGQDLNAWIDSNASRMAIKAQNDKMINDIIGVTGAVVMVASAAKGSSDGTLLGATGMMGAGINEEVQKQRKVIRAAESAKMVPESHLYAPFTVPSNGFRRSWFVVHTPDKKIATYARLRLKTIDGNVSEIQLPLVRQKQ